MGPKEVARQAKVIFMIPITHRSSRRLRKSGEHVNNTIAHPKDPQKEYVTGMRRAFEH